MPAADFDGHGEAHAPATWRDVQVWARGRAESGLVSVVVPVFNGASFLRSALESVAAQEYPRWELVVVDDGSSDQSGELARSFAAGEPRARVIHQCNEGHSAARNRGLLACRGEYLQFLDADDRLLPDKMKNQVAYLEQNPGVDIVTGEARYFGKHGRPLPMVLRPPRANMVADLLRRNVMCLNSPLTRRRVLGKVGGFKSRTLRGERVYGCEDWELWQRVALAGCRIAYQPQEVVHNLWHQHNAQHDRARMLDSALWALMENAPGVPLRKVPWWGLSVLETQLARFFLRHVHRPDWQRIATRVWRLAHEERGGSRG
jgi:glycosyltransferase involved in cell wall biosynthesis